MRVSKIPVIWVIVAGTVFSGCVERYFPDDEALAAGTLVVNAHLSGDPGKQTIRISRSDRLVYPKHKPESNCVVEVFRQNGDRIRFPEETPGEYKAEIPGNFLAAGSEYRLHVVTSDGTLYESDFVELHPAIGIDRVYYEVESVIPADPTQRLNGIRFYMDFEIDSDASVYMRWELIETYEYRNPQYEGFIYDRDRVIRPIPDSLSDRQCWITRSVPHIYTLYTGIMTGKQYSRLPLHFVSNETQRLKHGYSLLVRQYSLEEGAFRYWDQLKKNSQEMGGFYDRQPSLTPSNICNCNDPEEKVLGYFSVSGISEKRIFVSDPAGLEVPDRIICLPSTGPLNLRYIYHKDLPLFLSRATSPYDGSEIFGLTTRECLDCRQHAGSSGDPPDFWPKL